MSEAGHLLPPKFDPSDPSVRANPYPTYARLREVGRLCRGGPGQWVVTRYHDVAALLGDGRLQSHFPTEYHKLSAGEGPAGEFLERIMLHQDGPRHKALRRAMTRHFDGAAVRGLRGRVTRLVDDLLDAAPDSGLLEAVADLALPLPAKVMFEMMDIPSADRNELHREIMSLGKAFAPHVAPDDRAAADEAVEWLRRYTSALLERRRRNPGDDLLSSVLAAGLSEEEVIDNVVFLFFAGFETTSSVISNGCAALLAHPEQSERLRADRSLIPRAVEEFIRYDAPIQSRLRFVREPVEIDGRTIRPGRVLLLLIGSANRDERQFERPEELDVTRHPNPHLSFGGGDHYCLGARLARLECAVAFERLLRRFKELAPAGEPVRNVESPFRSYERVPMRVRPAYAGNDL